MYPSIEFHPHLNDALIVKASYTQPSVEAIFPKVIVGLQCGLSVLRGTKQFLINSCIFSKLFHLLLNRIQCLCSWCYWNATWYTLL